MMVGAKGTAMIDYGAGNWESVFALLVLGTVLFGFGLVSLRAQFGVANQRQENVHS